MSSNFFTHETLNQQLPKESLRDRTLNTVKPNQKNNINLSQSKDESNIDKFSSSLQIKKNDQTEKEQWKQSEIRKIFSLYFEFGSQWKLLQTQFVGKSSNSIKNRFYTVVRTFLKILFKEHPEITKKLPHEIPSKTILKFYQGREQFAKFKGFGKKILKAIDYDLNSKQLKKLAAKNIDQIFELFKIIFPNQAHRAESTKTKNESKRKKKCCQDQNNEENIKIASKDQKQILKTDDKYDYQEQGNQVINTNTNKLPEDLPQNVGQVSIVLVPTYSYVGLLGFNPIFSYF